MNKDKKAVELTPEQKEQKRINDGLIQAQGAGIATGVLGAGMLATSVIARRRVNSKVSPEFREVPLKAISKAAKVGAGLIGTGGALYGASKYTHHKYKKEKALEDMKGESKDVNSQIKK